MQKRNGYKLVLPVLMAMMLLLSACTKTVDFNKPAPISTLDPSGGLRLWATDNYEITAMYPHTWFRTDNTGALMLLFAPFTDKTPDYREFISLGAMPNEDGKTLKQIADNAVSDMQNLFGSIILKETKTARIGDYDAELRVFSGSIEDDNMKGNFIWYQYSWLMGEKTSYSITLSATDEMLDEYLTVFNGVIASMTLPAKA